MNSAKSVLWQQIQRLMTARWGEENLTRLASEARVGVAAPTTSTPTTLFKSLVMRTVPLSVSKLIFPQHSEFGLTGRSRCGILPSVPENHPHSERYAENIDRRQ